MTGKGLYSRVCPPCGPRHARLVLAEIAQEVAERHGLRVSDLKAHRRDRRAVLARHEAFYISRERTTKSFPQIGRFYDRDHTTVLYGIRKHRERLEHNT